MDIATIAKNFTEFYYARFEADRQSLAPLYREHSKLTWEGEMFQGVTAIIQRLTNLTFTKVLHQIGTSDAQPSSLDNSTLLISVTGLLKVDDGEQALNFTQVFVLAKEDSTFYVLNDIFRLNLG